MFTWAGWFEFWEVFLSSFFFFCLLGVVAGLQLPVGLLLGLFLGLVHGLALEFFKTSCYVLLPPSLNI